MYQTLDGSWFRSPHPPVAQLLWVSSNTQKFTTTILIYIMSCSVPLNYTTGVFGSFYYCLITISSSKPQFSLQNAPKQLGGRGLISRTVEGGFEK